MGSKFFPLRVAPFVKGGKYFLCRVISIGDMYIFSSSEHEVLMVSYCSQSMSVVRRAASTIALKAYSSYVPGPIDSILSRKHRDDL